MVQHQQAVAHHPGGRHQNSQHSRSAEPDKMNMFQQLPIGSDRGDAQTYADSAGQQRQDMRGTRKKVSGVGHAGKALFNLLLSGLR